MSEVQAKERLDNIAQQNTHRCGSIAIVGRPNVGKSTLMNRILGKKICITSHRPQTTQRNILGVKTIAETQFIYYDTPGWQGVRRRRIRVHRTSLDGMHVCLFVLVANNYSTADRVVLDALHEHATVPIIAVINKIDLLPSREDVLPLIERLQRDCTFKEYIPISALRDKGTAALEGLEKCVHNYLPSARHQFPPDYDTDCSEHFMVTEIIREKIMRQMGDELPYACQVLIERWQPQASNLEISACIQAERLGHKKMLIGKQGARIKKIGIAARTDMQKLLNRDITLHLWVRVLAVT